MMEPGRDGTIDEPAAAEKINPSHMSRAVRLALLAPDIVESILDDLQPEGMTLPGLTGAMEVGGWANVTRRGGVPE